MIKIRYKITLFFIFKQVVCYAIHNFFKKYFKKNSGCEAVTGVSRFVFYQISFFTLSHSRFKIL